MPEAAQPLAQRDCVPCRGGVPPLARDAVEAHLRNLPLWHADDDAPRIERRFRFKTFAEAFAFATKIAVLAEAQNHHPDLHVGWGFCTVSLQTKVIKGLHDNDFILAAKIDALAIAG